MITVERVARCASSDWTPEDRAIIWDRDVQACVSMVAHDCTDAVLTFAKVASQGEGHVAATP